MHPVTQRIHCPQIVQDVSIKYYEKGLCVQNFMSGTFSLFEKNVEVSICWLAVLGFKRCIWDYKTPVCKFVYTEAIEPATSSLS